MMKSGSDEDSRERMLARIATEMTSVTPVLGVELDAIRRLVNFAQSDTGQSRRVANFLLAWWNAENCGGFDLTDLWGVDREISHDMRSVFGLLGRISEYPGTLDPDLDAQFKALVRDWRPHLFESNVQERQ